MGLVEIINQIPGLTVKAGGGRSLNYVGIAGAGLPVIGGVLAYVSGLDNDAYHIVASYSQASADLAAAAVGTMAGTFAGFVAGLALTPVTVNEAIRKGARIPEEREEQTIRIPSSRDRIRKLFPDIEEQHIDAILQHDLRTPLKGGYSSGLVLSSDVLVAKQAAKENNAHEQRVYQWDLGSFDHYQPRLEEVVELENSSLMVLSNVDSLQSGFAKSGYIPFNADGSFNIGRYIKHNLFVMGLFHKEATKAAKEQGDDFLEPLIYQTLDGIPHYEAITTPLQGMTTRTYRQFKRDTPSRIVQEIGLIIDTFCHYLQQGEVSVIHGDWKVGNLPNGHVADYAIVQYGKEIVDIANFLSEPFFDLQPDDFKRYVKTYIGMRAEHDPGFRENTTKHQEMVSWLDSARMKELSIYASVMRKRDLSDPPMVERRQRFLHDIGQLLTTGTFH